MNESTIPVQVSTLEPASKPVIDRFIQVWTPTILLLSPDGKLYHDWSGYLPPSMYRTQLLLGLGKAALKQDRFEEAATRFNELADLFPTSAEAPEALYWAAVARYKGSHQADDLLGGWQKLQRRHPEN